MNRDESGPDDPSRPTAVAAAAEEEVSATEREPYWWVPLATVVGFLAVANYVWLSFM